MPWFFCEYVTVRYSFTKGWNLAHAFTYSNSSQWLNNSFIFRKSSNIFGHDMQGVLGSIQNLILLLNKRWQKSTSLFIRSYWLTSAPMITSACPSIRHTLIIFQLLQSFHKMSLMRVAWHVSRVKKYVVWVTHRPLGSMG